MNFRLGLFAFWMALSPVTIHAKASCADMIGTYRIPDYDAPLGLQETSQIFVDPTYTLGKPAFQIKREGAQYNHYGLYSGNRTPIKLIDSNRNKNVPAPIADQISCHYELSSDTRVIQLDLSRLDDTTLNQLLQYIASSWGSAVLDMGRADDFERLSKSSPQRTQHPLDLNALRNTRYFITSTVDMTGVISYTIFIPLDKTP